MYSSCHDTSDRTRGLTNVYVSRGCIFRWGWLGRGHLPVFGASTTAHHLVDGVEGHKGPQLGVKVQVPDDLLKGPEAAEGLEVRQRVGHLWLVIVDRVHCGSLSVELLGELLVWVRLYAPVSSGSGVVSGEKITMYQYNGVFR